MSDDDLGVMAFPIVGVVAVLGAYLVFAVYDALPWSTVSPQAQSVGANVANSAVSVLTADPTLLFLALAAVIGAILGLVGLAIALSGSGGGQGEM